MLRELNHRYLTLERPQATEVPMTLSSYDWTSQTTQSHNCGFQITLRMCSFYLLYESGPTLTAVTVQEQVFLKSEDKMKLLRTVRSLKK